MAAPAGNQFWKIRSKHGRNRLFKTPGAMLNAAYEYFQWCDDNPLMEQDFRGKDAIEVELPHMRAYTIHGLCLYLGVNTEYFNHFETEVKGRDDKTSKDFCKVITRIKEVIYEQKFVGAAAGMLKENLIARELGLTDKSNITIEDEKGRIAALFPTEEELAENDPTDK